MSVIKKFSSDGVARIDGSLPALKQHGLGAKLNALLTAFHRAAGVRAINLLRVASDVVDQQTSTIGSDVYEVSQLTTDTGVNTSGSDLDHTDPTATVTIASHGLSAGALLRVEDEIMEITGVIDANNVVVKRGHSGTTIVAHADATDIYKAAQSVTAGRIPVGIGSTVTPTVFSPSLAAVINSHGTEKVSAVSPSANEVLIYSDDPSALALACTETLTGSNNAWASATMYGGAAPAQVAMSIQSRVPKAVEVAVGKLHLMFDFTPAWVIVQVRVTSTGVVLLWGGTVAISGGRVTLTNNATNDWAATDTVTVLAYAANTEAEISGD